MNNGNIRYMYFGNKSLFRHTTMSVASGYGKVPRTGVITAAVELDGDSSDTGLVVNFGLAFCSPKDPFIKVKGRRIAEGRLRTRRGPQYFTVIDHREDVSVYDAVMESINEILGEGNVPRWAKQFRCVSGGMLALV